MGNVLTEIDILMMERMIGATADKISLGSVVGMGSRSLLELGSFDIRLAILISENGVNNVKGGGVVDEILTLSEKNCQYLQKREEKCR